MATSELIFSKKKCNERDGAKIACLQVVYQTQQHFMMCTALLSLGGKQYSTFYCTHYARFLWSMRVINEPIPLFLAAYVRTEVEILEPETNFGVPESNCVYVHLAVIILLHAPCGPHGAPFPHHEALLQGSSGT